MFRVIESPDALLNLTELGIVWVLYHVVPEFWCASKLPINVEYKLLSIDFSIAIILVNFEKSLTVSWLALRFLKMISK